MVFPHCAFCISCADETPAPAHTAPYFLRSKNTALPRTVRIWCAPVPHHIFLRHPCKLRGPHTAPHLPRITFFCATPPHPPHGRYTVFRIFLCCINIPRWCKLHVPYTVFRIPVYGDTACADLIRHSGSQYALHELVLVVDIEGAKLHSGSQYALHEPCRLAACADRIRRSGSRPFWQVRRC